MKRLNQVLVVGFLTVMGGLTAGRAELVARQPDSIFDVDGLMVDYSEPEPIATNTVFQAGIKQFPLMDVRKPIMTPRPSRIRSAVQSSGLAQGAARANIQAADNYAKEQNWTRALAEIQQGLEVDPGNPLLIRKAAAYAALARKFGVADEYFQRVLMSNPDSLVFLTGRAGVLIRLLRLKEADDLIQKALAIDPTFLAARFDALCVQIARGDTDIPDSGWDMLNTESVVELANWLDADKDDYVKALSPEGYAKLCDIVLGPGTDTRVTEIVGLLRTAGLAANARQWDADVDALSKVQKAGVRAVGLDVDIGRSLFQKGDRNAALAHFKALVDRYPKTGSVLYDYAYVLINMEMYSQASEVLERVCKMDPTDGPAAFALACTYAALGQMDKAWPILTLLASSHAADMPVWMTGDTPYQAAIRKDPRYPGLEKSFEAAQPVAP
jgi:tetratricopeptide (TPR) repeat protein